MKFLKYLAIAGVVVAIASCSAKKENNNEAKEQYGHTLADSIQSIEVEIDSCRSQAALAEDQIGVWMRDFTTVANPREAGSYMIMTSWRKRYPLSSTGLVARINDSGQFELIAALSGRAFDRISVAAPASSVTSAIVPHDQALNYRSEGLTTVMFTGPEADAIGELISDNELNPLTLDYMQGGVVKSWRIPADYAKMISYTWLLYSSKRDLAKAQAKIPMLQEKIKILRIHQNNLTPNP